MFINKKSTLNKGAYARCHLGSDSVGTRALTPPAGEDYPFTNSRVTSSGMFTGSQHHRLS